MTQTRIYLPLDAEGVRQLASSREVPSAPLAAFAVTERLERSQPAGDEEEWEYAAMAEAFAAAARAQSGPALRRVVLAADVDPSWVSPRPGDDLAGVLVAEALPLARVVSFHVDETAGDDGMDDLLWYDVTELDEVLRLL
jgi:hypothetical protein